MTTDPLMLRHGPGRYALKIFEDAQVRAFFSAKPYDLAFQSPSRARDLRRLDIDLKRLVYPSQVHGARVARVGQARAGRSPAYRAGAIRETDALVTDIPGVTICILTADCLPVFLLDTRKRAVGIIHAGWRGLRQAIITRTLSLMKEAFASRPQDMLAAFGPSLGACCYEVGDEFVSYFPGCVRHHRGKFFMDLALRARLECERLGVPPARIYESRMCTFCRSDELYSCRREGQKTGRSLSAISLI